MRLYAKMVLGICAIVAFVFSIEFIYFYTILIRPGSNANADAIVVFSGADERIQKGYRLANRCMANYLIVSPRKSNQVAFDNATYKKRACYQNLIENHAMSTFQNALFAGELIERKQLASAILVTHAAHMPRSYLLFRLQLLGKGVAVHPVAVTHGTFSKFPWRWKAWQKKKIYNEMMELWGSLFEMAAYRFHGKLPEKSIKRTKIYTLLRRYLLIN